MKGFFNCPQAKPTQTAQVATSPQLQSNIAPAEPGTALGSLALSATLSAWATDASKVDQNDSDEEGVNCDPLADVDRDRDGALDLIGPEDVGALPTMSDDGGSHGKAPRSSSSSSYASPTGKVVSGRGTAEDNGEDRILVASLGGHWPTQGPPREGSDWGPVLQEGERPYPAEDVDRPTRVSSCQADNEIRQRSRNAPEPQVASSLPQQMCPSMQARMRMLAHRPGLPPVPRAAPSHFSSVPVSVPLALVLPTDSGFRATSPPPSPEREPAEIKVSRVMHHHAK